MRVNTSSTSSPVARTEFGRQLVPFLIDDVAFFVSEVGLATDKRWRDLFLNHKAAEIEGMLSSKSAAKLQVLKLATVPKWDNRHLG